MTQPQVLLIEACDQTTVSAADCLQREMLRVCTICTGAEGLVAARRLQPDVILLGVHLPDTDGFEVCRQLKTDPQTIAIPVIFFSSENRTSQKIRGLDLGAIDYVTKPVDEAELLARVRAALRTKHLLDLLAERARLDGLTGLWNRTYFDEELAGYLRTAARRHQTVGVLMIDLDHFKSINDEHGHPVGDRVLQRIADVLRSSCRAGEVVCRYGGEEFSVIAADVTHRELRLLGERLRHLIEHQRIHLSAGVLRVTASVGAALTVATDGSTEAQAANLVAAADAQLYAAKEAGRNRVHIAPGRSPASTQAE
jgi:diguanylate cyclase (GGDEF)-like protein